MTRDEIREALYSPVRMTHRARAYLTAGGLRHFLIATVLLRFGHDFEGLTMFDWVQRIAPMFSWSAVFLGAAGLLWTSALLGSDVIARLGLTLAALCSGVWAACFAWVAIEQAQIDAPTGVTLLAVVVFLALAVKDLVVCGQPLQSPLEKVVQRYAMD